MLRVALLQMLPDASNQEVNAERAEEFCRKAASAGADIALMPEMFNIGYTGFEDDENRRQQWQQQAVSRDSHWVQRFGRLAGDLQMAIAAAYLEKTPNWPRNAVTLFDRTGREVLTYRKVHTCDFTTMEASTDPGEDWPVVELDTGAGPVQVGCMICYDREHPESARCLMLNGAEVVLTPNACTLCDLQIMQFQIRAYENAMAVAMANYAAPLHNGRSCAFGAEGKLVVQAGEEEGICMAPFDLDKIRDYRSRTIWGDAFRRPHRYGAITQQQDLPVFRRKNAFGRPFDCPLR